MRPPSPTFERVKRTLFLVGLATALEYVDPLPFFKSRAAWLIYIAILFEVMRQFLVYRLETSNEAVITAELYKQKWETQKDRLTANTRFRIRRFIFIATGVWVWGLVVSLFTDRCEGAFSCAAFSVTVIVEELPMLFQVAVGIVFAMMQLVLMMLALTKVGFGKIIPPGTTGVSFDDVYGQDEPRDMVKEQIDLLENDEAVAAAGGYMPKGVLLTGPPGTGKTMLAKAAANASTKPLILLPPGAFASTFMGINYLKIQQLGRWIRKYGKRFGGVIVFLDEIDVLGTRGGVEEGHAEPWFNREENGCMTVDPYHPVVVTGSGGMNEGTLTAFLAMIDGMEEPRGLVNKILAVAGFKALPPPPVRVFYMGATNRPSAVDPALKRAGRLGREVRVDYPKHDGRLHTYTGYLSKVQHSLEDADIDWAARNHYRGTGAEIQDVVNEAVLISFRHDNEEDGLVTMPNMMKAMISKRFGESGGVFENPDNVRSVAVHEAGHALVMYALLRHRQNIWFVSIEQRGKTGGMVVPAPLFDDWKQQSNEMLAQIAVSLGSRVAEVAVNGQVSNGHGGDGPAATNLAEKMVLMGHNDQLSFSAERDPENFHLEREDVLWRAYDMAEEIIALNNDALDALVELLVEEHTVYGPAVHALFEEYEV